MGSRPGLVLASGSPRRKEILETLGLEFEVQPSDVEERRDLAEPPVSYVQRLASEKALSVSRGLKGANPPFILGADTVVVLGFDVLEKPQGIEEAAAMIGRLSGTEHQVITGLALCRSGTLREALSVVTRVRFRELTEDTVLAYAASGEGRDKAGAYGIQGLGAGLVERIEGSYHNVMGLPAAETVELLLRHGVLTSWP